MRADLNKNHTLDQRPETTISGGPRGTTRWGPTGANGPRIQDPVRTHRPGGQVGANGGRRATDSVAGLGANGGPTDNGFRIRTATPRP